MAQAFWLSGGLYFCDEHKPIACIPFFGAPSDAVCNECSGDVAESHLTFRRESEDTEEGREIDRQLSGRWEK